MSSSDKTSRDYKQQPYLCNSFTGGNGFWTTHIPATPKWIACSIYFLDQLFFTGLCCQPCTHCDRLDLEEVHHLDVHDFSGEFCSTTYVEITSPTVPAEAWQKLACVFTTCSPSSDCTACTTLITNWTPSLSHKLYLSLIQLLTLFFFSLVQDLLYTNITSWRSHHSLKTIPLWVYWQNLWSNNDNLYFRSP